jgi:hypothetical protein
MMKRTMAGFLVLGFLAGAAYLAAQAKIDVSGAWELTMTTPRGERTSTITFKQDGENLTVVTTGRNDEEITGTGTLKGADIEWSITRTTPRGEFTMTYKGKVEGDTMAGEAQMGDFGSAEWTAKRKTA